MKYAYRNPEMDNVQVDDAEKKLHRDQSEDWWYSSETTQVLIAVSGQKPPNLSPLVGFTI